MNHNYRNIQRGTVLISSLLIVFVISMLGIAAALQVVSLRKVSAVNYDHILSINNAESALSEAHSIISANYLSPNVIKDLSIELKETSNWWRTDANWSAATVVNSVSEGAPAYLIEDSGTSESLMMGTNNIKRRFYRVTARANGKGQSLAFLQSYYAMLE